MAERVADASRVVAGVGDPAHSLAVVDAAAMRAHAHGRPLTLLCACPVPHNAGPVTLLSVLSRRAATTWPELTVTARNVTGRPETVLREASRSAGSLVVGRRRRGRPLGPAPGAVAREVASYADCPVMVVPAGVPAGSDDPVLVALSGHDALSEHDDAVLRHGLAEAATRGVRLVATHVWSGAPPTGLPTVDWFASRTTRNREAADRVLTEALTGWATHYPEVEVARQPVDHPDPARALRDAADRASLLVIGGRQLHHDQAHPLGTVAATVIAEAGRPVLAVPAPEAVPLSGTAATARMSAR